MTGLFSLQNIFVGDFRHQGIATPVEIGNIVMIETRIFLYIASYINANEVHNLKLLKFYSYIFHPY